jgi:cell division protein FtsN
LAQRDYVRKKKTHSKKNKTKTMPRLMMVIGIMIVVLFAAILYTLKQNNPHDKRVSQPKLTPKPEATLPERPTERWAYLKELENPQSHNEKQVQHNDPKTTLERDKILNSFRTEGIQQNTAPEPSNKRTAESIASSTSINTPATTVTQHPTKKWMIQCGAFKDQNNAQTLKAKIAMAGAESYIQQVGQLYRVVAGSNYTDKTQAAIVAKQLNENGIKDCRVSSK